MKRIAYWGHGYNHQEREPGVSEWLKRRLLTRVDWWFSYTDSVTKYLTDHGVRPQMISTVYNTIDVAELRSAVENVDVAGTRSRIGIAADASVALFCGALTVAKNLSFLLEVSRRVRSLVPTFELVIVGDGPARETLEREARDMPYVHFAGAAFADARAPFFAVADVLAMPSQVGLSAVDAFAAGIPIFTTDLPTHGPELDYLEPGVNAMITSYSPVAFADTLVEVLRDRQRLDRMKQAALATAQRLPLSRMVDAFADGILRCLQGDVS
jgi:glycosyltransferase involved in cell wall biosynthesis